MEIMEPKSREQLEAECQALIDAIRAYKRGEGEPDPRGMLEWAAEVAANLQHHVRGMACYNMTAPFAVAALRTVADNISDAYEEDMDGFSGLAMSIQTFLQEKLGLVRVKVPDHEE